MLEADDVLSFSLSDMFFLLFRKRLSIRHHPDKESGSEERFEWLKYLYDSVATKQVEAM